MLAISLILRVGGLLLVQALSPSATSEIYLVSGQAQDYVIDVGKGDFVRIVAESTGIGVDVQLIPPNGVVTERCSARTPGTFRITFVAAAQGKYRIKFAGRGYENSGRVFVYIAERMSPINRAVHDHEEPQGRDNKPCPLESEQ